MRSGVGLLATAQGGHAAEPCDQQEATGRQRDRRGRRRNDRTAKRRAGELHKSRALAEGRQHGNPRDGVIARTQFDLAGTPDGGCEGRVGVGGTGRAGAGAILERDGGHTFDRAVHGEFELVTRAERVGHGEIRRVEKREGEVFRPRAAAIRERKRLPAIIQRQRRGIGGCSDTQGTRQRQAKHIPVRYDFSNFQTKRDREMIWTL